VDMRADGPNQRVRAPDEQLRLIQRMCEPFLNACRILRDKEAQICERLHEEPACEQAVGAALHAADGLKHAALSFQETLQAFFENSGNGEHQVQARCWAWHAAGTLGCAGTLNSRIQFINILRTIVSSTHKHKIGIRKDEHRFRQGASSLSSLYH
jgi:hypothetical protein